MIDGWVGDVTYVTVATRGPKRFFDLDAVRTEHKYPELLNRPVYVSGKTDGPSTMQHTRDVIASRGDPAGAPPLDWHIDNPDAPDTLPARLITAMCPQRVCTTCGKPSERIVATSRPIEADDRQRVKHANGERPAPGRQDRAPEIGWQVDRTTLGWSDCGHDAWRPGVVLDPFTGGNPMPIEYRVGDVHDRLAEIGDSSIDLIVTSPPFLALRSYLPADHPDKHKEIGSEPTPAAFIDTLLQLTAEFGRVLAPHGSLCVELGDTFAGGGGWTGDDPKHVNRTAGNGGSSERGGHRQMMKAGGWPLAKSLTGIPQSYMLSLVYGWNVLDRHGPDSPAGRWRARNQIVWARPNPPVGALGDKFRPATSYITVACRSPRRFFDLDAVRTELKPETISRGIVQGGIGKKAASERGGGWSTLGTVDAGASAGAPPLDWHSDLEDGDWLWRMSTQPYKGAHYATFPLELPTRLVMAMCPLRVCVQCGRPSERITEDTPEYAAMKGNWKYDGENKSRKANPTNLMQKGGAEHVTTGWSDCGHNDWRTGVVLDPFAGSGTTLQAAQNVGRHAIGIDLDPRNADLARTRVGMFMDIDT